MRSKRSFTYDGLFRILAAHTLEREQNLDEARVGGPHHPMLRRFFVFAPIYARPECGKARRSGTLDTQAIALFEMYKAPRQSRNVRSSVGKKMATGKFTHNS